MFSVVILLIIVKLSFKKFEAVNFSIEPERKNLKKKFNHFVILSHDYCSTWFDGVGILRMEYCSMVL